MIEFCQIEDTDPALAHSPMVRALEKTFAHISEHGGIGLTSSNAFQRVFVHWAAREFDWPGYTEGKRLTRCALHPLPRSVSRSFKGLGADI
jgi:hypothetical protein